jgi:hypothetical protein
MARRGDCVPWNLTERVPFSVLMRAGTGGWFRKLAPSAAGATSHSGRPTTRQKLEKLREAGAEAGATPQKLGPPPNPRGQEVGATPQSARTRSWGHPPIRADNESPELGPPVSSSLTGTAGKPKTEAQNRSWGHPPIRADNESPELGPPVSSSLTGTAVEPKTVPPRFSPKQCHPSVRRHHADLRCHPAFRVPRWCHPSVCPRQFAERSVPPPNLGGGSGIVAPGLSAQSCSRPPALVASGASPTAADCARWRP